MITFSSQLNSPKNHRSTSCIQSVMISTLEIECTLVWLTYELKRNRRQYWNILTKLDFFQCFKQGILWSSYMLILEPNMLLDVSKKLYHTYLENTLSLLSNIESSNCIPKIVKNKWCNSGRHFVRLCHQIFSPGISCLWWKCLKFFSNLPNAVFFIEAYLNHTSIL